MTSPLTLPEGAMNAIVAKAILDGLEPEQRNLLIQSALEGLITQPESPDRWGAPKKLPSPLQQAFTQAITIEANKIAREIIEADEGLREQIRQKIRDGVVAALADENMDWAVTNVIQEALREAKTKRERDY